MRIPNFKVLCKCFQNEKVQQKMIILIFQLIMINATFIIFGFQISRLKDDLRSKNLLYVPMVVNRVAQEEGSVGSSMETRSNKNNHILSHIVASKAGTRYYFTWCVSARIKEENKIYFDTEEEATERGLELSSQCQK